MDAQTTNGAPSAGSKNTEAVGDNVSSQERAQRFLKVAEARRTAEAKPAKESTTPAEEPADDDTPTAEETTTEVDTEVPAKEPLQDKEPAPETDEDVLSKFDPKAKEKIQKRINSITAARKAAEEKVAALEAKVTEADTLKAQLAQAQEQLAQVQAKAPEASKERQQLADPSDPTSNASSTEDLAQLRKDAIGFMAKYDDDYSFLIQQAKLAGDSSIQVEGVENPIEIADLLRARKLARETLTEFIPARQKFLEMKAVNDQWARTIYPEVFDKKTPIYHTAQGFMNKNPELKRSANAETITALVMLGFETLTARQQKAAEAALKKPPTETPPDLGESTASASKVAARAPGASLKRETDEAKKAYESSGKTEDKLVWERLKRKSLVAR
jgi:hypothetical protein